jgi:hypothetical protein
LLIGPSELVGTASAGEHGAYAEQQPDRGLLVFPHPKTIANRRLINELAIRYRTPAIYPYRYFASDGVSSPTGRTKSINGEEPSDGETFWADRRN